MGFRLKTRPGRLAQLDAVVVTLAASLLARRDGAFSTAPVVDLGVGAHPWTTEELAAAIDPVPVVGIDAQEAVVARARAHERPGLAFVVGSFNLPVRARLVRVMNVVRDLWPEQVPEVHARLGRGVLEGGVVIEGSCGPTGEVGAAHWMVKRGSELHRDALLMWLDGTRGTAPLLFRDRLPKDLRRDHAHPIDGLLHAWMDAHGRVETGPRRLERAVVELGDPTLRVVGTGAVMWTPEGGVPVRQTAEMASKSSL